jgi:hypothetical protein
MQQTHPETRPRAAQSSCEKFVFGSLKYIDRAAYA